VSFNADYALMIWEAAGLSEILQQKKIRRVVVPEGDEGSNIPTGWDDVLRLYLSGKAFFYDHDLYILPERRFIFNSFRYECPGAEPLRIFVGYRGHPHPYPLVLTPSVLRDAEQKGHDRYVQCKEIDAGNLLREAYWRHDSRALQDLEACGILQHHNTIGDADILDLSYEPDVAKLFALSELTSSGYEAKSWRDEEDYSCVYKIVVRVLGGTDQPIELSHHGSLTVLPFNLCPSRWLRKSLSETEVSVSMA